MLSKISHDICHDAINVQDYKIQFKLSLISDSNVFWDFVDKGHQIQRQNKNKKKPKKKTWTHFPSLNM